MDFHTALDKAQKFCAYQERCISEMRRKLNDFEISEVETEKIIQNLIESKFIDEDRFTRMFISGKIKNNQWGKVKIRFELRHRKIPETVINKHLTEFDEEEYLRILSEILKKKKPTIKETNKHILKQKLINFAVSKGFETELILGILKENESK